MGRTKLSTIKEPKYTNITICCTSYNTMMIKRELK
jgi:hypothetical protein